MAYCIEKNERLKEAFARIGAEEIDIALNELRASDRNIDSIHNVRKNIKRLRALLRAFRFAFHDEWFRAENRRLREAARKMSPLRDARVKLCTLLGVKPIGRIGWRLRRRLVHHETLLSRKIPVLRETVCQTLQIAGQDFASQQSAHITSRGLVKGLTRIYRQGHKMFKAAFRSRSVEDLHELRKRTKSVGYAFQLVNDLRIPKISRIIKRAEKLSDALGVDHDLFMVEIALARENRARPAPDYPSLAARIVARRAKLLKKTCKFAARLYDEKPSHLRKRLNRGFRRK